MLLSYYIWGRGKARNYPFDDMRPLIALFHLICIFPPKDWNLRTFSSLPASISISFGDAWLDRRLTYASHNAEREFLFPSCTIFIIFVLDSEEHKREGEKWIRFILSFLGAFKTDDNFSFVHFCTERGGGGTPSSPSLSPSLCLKCIIFSNDATARASTRYFFSFIHSSEGLVMILV